MSKLSDSHIIIVLIMTYSYSNNLSKGCRRRNIRFFVVVIVIIQVSNFKDAISLGLATGGALLSKQTLLCCHLVAEDDIVTNNGTAGALQNKQTNTNKPSSGVCCNKDFGINT